MNNPDKVKKLNNEGLEVIKIIKLKIEPNEINKGYLNTKKMKSNHIYDWSLLPKNEVPILRYVEPNLIAFS